VLPYELRLIAYVVATASVVATALVLATVERDRSSHYWLTAGVAVPSLVFVYEMVAGLAGLLTSGVLLAMAVSGFGVSVAIARRAGFEPAASVRVECDRIRNALAIVRASRLLRFLFVLSMLVLAWVVAVGRLIPPVSWDSLTYHLPPIVKWMHAERIHWTTIGHPFYPKNGELFVLWNTIFPRSQTFMNLTQVYFALLGTLGVYTTGRDLSLDMENALVGGSFFLLSPIVLTQAVTTYVDLTYAALAVVSLAFFTAFYRTGARRHLALIGIATGLMLGVKTAGIVLAGLVGLATTATVWFVHGRCPRRTTVQLGVLAATIATFGSYWYARSFVVLGNPIYPVPVEVFGRTVFEGILSPERLQRGPWEGTFVESIHGPYDKTTFASRLYVSWYEKIQIYGKGIPVGSFGPHWAILGVPSVLLFGYDSLGRRDLRSVTFAGLALVPLLLSATYFARYTIVLLALGGVAVGFVRGTVSPGSRRAVSVLLAILLLSSAVLSSGFQPWRYEGVVERSLSNPDDRTSMVVRPDGSAIDHANYSRHVEEGSTIGYVPRGDIDYGEDTNYQAFPFNLYDGHFRNEIVNVGDVGTREAFERRIATEQLDYLLVYETKPQVEFAQNGSATQLLFRNDDWYLFEVVR
jgi:hypothetical protein